MNEDRASAARTGFEVAIIGMSCRVPGAASVEQFWTNLRNGVEAISRFTEEEVLATGVHPRMLGEPNFVRAGGVLEDVEMFDAPFFGYSPREAELIDPQQRFFLECAWEALEHAGYGAGARAAAVGVFAGAGMSGYLRNLYSGRGPDGAAADALQLLLGNDKDYLATRVSYKMNLKGPSVTVQSACSTSLLAAHLACQSLLSGACDVALAGGVTIGVPQKTGYVYREGGIASPDGHTRAFDAEARGCVGGSGVGVVVLKRLEDALDDGDTIHAVIKGSAANNDGSQKVGFTAPSVEGQAEVVSAALDMAEVDPGTITYVETHGTATPLGDPVEIAALTQAFRGRTQKRGFCAVGSVKTNIGHLDTAAGVAGLIKTVLALKHGELPPSLNFRTPNPQIDFANSPFYVCSELSEWRGAGGPRRAGLSSFGIGGTNVHMILEEAPPPAPPPRSSRALQLFVLSSKTKNALEAATTNLAGHLERESSLDAADVAYTLQTGRAALSHRRLVLCGGLGEAAAALGARDPKLVKTGLADLTAQSVVFMFPGQGAQSVNMGSELYKTEPAFREPFDRCCELLRPHLGADLRGVVYPPEGADASEAAERLRQTLFAQPALFAVGYALAQLWREWGVRPQAMIGHSVGEYLAACLAGVFTLEDALGLVAARARLMQQLPSGSMLALSLPEAEVEALIEGGPLSLAAVNGPSLCVVSGPTDAAEELARRLDGRGLDYRTLRTSHAFHSAMMEPILEPFRQHVRALRLDPPRARYVSNVTGTWITSDEATSPDYWARHLRRAVRFADGVGELLKEGKSLLLELGPGDTLCALALRHPARTGDLPALPSLSRPRDSRSDVQRILSSLGELWLRGVDVDWAKFHARERRRRVPLPTYPFERKRYWVECGQETGRARAARSASLKKPDVADWFYVPAWKQSVAPDSLPAEERTPRERRWLLFTDDFELGGQVSRRLEGGGAEVITVRPGPEFGRAGEREYVINPRGREDYDALVESLQSAGGVPGEIVHLWSAAPPRRASSEAESLEDAQWRGFYSLLFLAQALGEQVLARSLGTRDAAESFRLTVFTNGVHGITGGEALSPENATVMGPCLVIPQEYPNFKCRSIDLAPDADSADAETVDQLIAELKADSAPQAVAYRRRARWLQTFEPVRLDGRAGRPPLLRERGVYLITGGLGGVGLEVAQYLARSARARIVLLNRSTFPERAEWDAWLSGHDEADATSVKIRRLRAVERLGAEVLTLSADVTVREELEAAVARAERTFGRVNGVVHAAGLPPESTIQRSTPETFALALAPKLSGTLLLADVFKDAGLDFLLLFSSLRSLIGGAGSAAYSAANRFLDAFAHARNSRRGTLITSVNWDGWLEVGMSLGAARTSAREELSEIGMSAAEGADALSRILWGRLPQVVVSVSDLEAVFEQERDFVAAEALDELAASRAAAPAHPRPELENEYVAPRNRAEQTLARIWEELLGLEKVGVNDNFFELGGDSVISIQIIARANQAGLRLTPKQVFEHQTVAALAADAAPDAADACAVVESPHGPAAGPAPLTPTQRWFFERGFGDPNHFNQAVLLEARRGLDYELLRLTVRELLRRHDALRLRFTREGDSWRQVCADVGDEVPCGRVDFSTLAPAEQPAAVEAAAAELQTSLDLSTGPLVRVALFDLGDGRPQRLLIVIHHLAVDAVSWRILLEDFEAAYGQLSRGERPRLPERTTSFKRWAERLVEYARSEELSAEAEYWLATAGAQAARLPVDYPGGANTVGSARAVEVSLDEEETPALLQAPPRTRRAQAQDVLLAALARSFRKWTGSASLLIDLEGLGREPLFDGVDLSRTVGWFTPVFPVLLDVSGSSGVGDELARVKERLRAVPRGGVGYGLLRYLSPDVELAERLRALPRAEVIFLYLGQLGRVLPESSPYALASESSGPHCGAREGRSHLLEVSAQVVEGRLRAQWVYSENVHRAETIEALAREFVEAVRSMVGPRPAREEKKFAASDFAAFGWSQEDVEGIVARLERG